jgi:hypothetical protein
MNAHAKRAEVLARHREDREREDDARRNAVIAEFDGNVQALANEVIYLRRAIYEAAEALRWAQTRAPFAILGPGPHWQPRKSDAREEANNG